MMEQAPKTNMNASQRTMEILQNPDVMKIVAKANSEYWYWSDLKYKRRPEGVSAEELWAAVKFSRTMIGGWQLNKLNFILPVTNRMQELCHYFDMNFGGTWGNTSIIPDDGREMFLVSSIIEEAISSSQMEGAATTRKVAKDMLRKNISPKNRSDQMIRNNYDSIRFISEHKNEELTPELLQQINRMMTKKTLDDENDAGRFRIAEDNVVVEDGITHEVVHTPPPAKELPELIELLCKFANSTSNGEGAFIHPILKAIYLHFMVAYMHPFVDGNGRTARAIFYWCMLRNGYWLTEYLSISKIIYNSKSSYERAFLQTESDDNDLGYFVIYHLHVLDLAFKELKNYIQRKIIQRQQSFDFYNLGGINERQAMILSLFRDNSRLMLTIKELENRFNVCHTTAQNDVDALVVRGLLCKTAVNRVKSVYTKGDKFDELCTPIVDKDNK